MGVVVFEGELDEGVMHTAICLGLVQPWSLQLICVCCELHVELPSFQWCSVLSGVVDMKAFCMVLSM